MNIAIVGCGDIGGFVAIGCRLNRKINITACVDTSVERSESFAKKHRISRSYQDYRELFQHKDIDAVYLGVPHFLHHSMIIDCLENGYNVFCEKPVTVSLNDALDVCRKSRETGKKVGINYQYRYDHNCNSVIEACRSGELGNINYALCNTSWSRTEKYFSGAPWHGKKAESGGGTLITQGSHIIDITLKALKSFPVEVAAVTDKKKFTEVEVEDFAMGIVKFENGAAMQITSTMAAEPEQKLTMDVYGSLGRAHYTGGDFSNIKSRGIKVKKRKAPVRGFHPLLRSIEGFRRWVKEDEPFLVPVEESLMVLAVVEAMYRSADSGKYEKVDTRYREFLEG